MACHCLSVTNLQTSVNIGLNVSKINFIFPYVSGKTGCQATSMSNVYFNIPFWSKDVLKKTTPRKKYYKGKSNICCLCFENKFSDKFTDIFTVVATRKRMAETIYNVLVIVYEDIEGQPTKVCCSCQGKLDSFSKLRTMS